MCRNVFKHGVGLQESTKNAKWILENYLKSNVKKIPKHKSDIEDMETSDCGKFLKIIEKF